MNLSLCTHALTHTFALFRHEKCFPIFALGPNHCAYVIQSSIFMLSSMEFMNVMNMGNKVRTPCFKVTLDEGF